MRNGTLIRGLGLTTGLMLALAGSAQAGTGGDPPTQPYPLAHSTRVAVQGHHVAAGASSADRGSPCRMPATSLSLAPKERAVEMRQISFNPRTCRAVFERGVPPRWAKRPAAGKIQGQGRAAGPGAGSGVSTLAAGYTWGGFSSAYYKDRSTGRIYNLIEDGADWNSSRGCIGANSTWWRTAADTDTGWFRVSHSWSFVGNICSYVSSTSRGQFRDRNFTGCSSGPVVDAYYTRVRFTGYPNGNIGGSRSGYTQPSCTARLVAVYALYRR